MQGMECSGDRGSPVPGDREALPTKDLERIVHRATPLDTAFQTLARHQEEQDRIAEDLLEREIWALSEILARSGPLWNQPTRPTLRFDIVQLGDPAPFHLELGSFAHLAALVAPTAEEQELTRTPAPCWARVTLNPARQIAGQSGALACSYVPIATAEAIAVVGFPQILGRVEDATRVTGKALLVEAHQQAERQARLLAVERMLHVAPDSGTDPTGRGMALHMRLALMLFGNGSSTRLVLAGVYVTCVVLLCYVLIAFH